MSYTPSTDFLSLFRRTSGGVRSLSVPGLDWLVSAFARAGLFQLAVSDTPPTSDQSTTAWFRTASSSWASEGALFLWDADIGDYAPATTMLWAELLSATNTATNIQIITTAGPIDINRTADIVLVNQTIGAPITLVMPLASTKVGGVLISDWKGDASLNAISIVRSGADVFPGGATTWGINADTASVFFRPVPGLGYVV